MSKTFETNALKGKSLSAGMKRRIAELEQFGVKEADLTVMEQDADKAIEMIREVDSLREEVTRKLQAANEQLNSLRDRAAVYRKIILNKPTPRQSLTGLSGCFQFDKQEFIGLFYRQQNNPSTPIHSRAETIAANSSGS